MRATATVLTALVSLSASWSAQDDSPPSAKPWTPPQTAISADFIEATRFLLQHGLADPRGGEYREATIVIRDTWQAKAQSVTIHGWVFPDGHVVTWDGLSYETESVGPRLELEKDVEARVNHSAAPFRGLVPIPANPPLGTALLLILGERELAEKTLTQPLEKDRGRLFSTLADSFLVPLFHRAVHAHMAGDDRSAYKDARILEKIGPEFEAEAVRIYGREMVDRLFESSLQEPGDTKVFMFLNPIPELAADSKRRLDNPRVKPDLEAIIDLPKLERIRKLIESLDEVAARQWGQPGGVSVVADPIAAALEAEGEDVVEQLIDVLEKDDRLTRSVSFGRDFFPHRNLISVRAAAFAIVSNILQLSLTAREDPYELQSVEELRAFWKANKGRSRAERLFAILADDRGNYSQWLEAATQIVQPIDIRQEGGWIARPDRKPGAPPVAIVGEELKTKANPSVSDLMARRALQVAGKGEITSSGDQFRGADALRLGLALAKWDMKASIPTLKALLERAIVLTSDSRLRGNAADSNFPVAGVVVSKLVEAGDAPVWKLYEDLLANFEPDSFINANVFRPLWTAAKNPNAARIAKQVFLDDDSKFMARYRRDGNVYQITSNILSPWLKIPAFRELLIRLLDDKKEIGTVSRNQSGISFRTMKGGSGSMGFDFSKDPDSAIGDEATFRVCDQVAMHLVQLKGCPIYNPVWKEAKRNAALKQLQKYISSIGNRVEEVLPKHILDRYQLDLP